MASQQTRRLRPTSSPELQAAMRLVASFSAGDLAVAVAMTESSYRINLAAAVLGVRTDAMRQRVATFVRHFEAALPGMVVGRGEVGMEVSYDQREGMRYSLGVDDQGRGQGR